MSERMLLYPVKQRVNLRGNFTENKNDKKYAKANLPPKEVIRKNKAIMKKFSREMISGIKQEEDKVLNLAWQMGFFQTNMSKSSRKEVQETALRKGFNRQISIQEMDKKSQANSSNGFQGPDFSAQRKRATTSQGLVRANRMMPNAYMNNNVAEVNNNSGGTPQKNLTLVDDKIQIQIQDNRMFKSLKGSPERERNNESTQQLHKSFTGVSNNRSSERKGGQVSFADQPLERTRQIEFQREVKSVESSSSHEKVTENCGNGPLEQIEGGEDSFQLHERHSRYNSLVVPKEQAIFESRELEESSTRQNSNRQYVGGQLDVPAIESNEKPAFSKGLTFQETQTRLEQHRRPGTSHDMVAVQAGSDIFYDQQRPYDAYSPSPALTRSGGLNLHENSSNNQDFSTQRQPQQAFQQQFGVNKKNQSGEVIFCGNSVPSTANTMQQTNTAVDSQSRLKHILSNYGVQKEEIAEGKSVAQSLKDRRLSLKSQQSLRKRTFERQRISQNASIDRGLGKQQLQQPRRESDVGFRRDSVMSSMSGVSSFMAFGQRPRQNTLLKMVRDVDSMQGHVVDTKIGLKRALKEDKQRAEIRRQQAEEKNKLRKKQQTSKKQQIKKNSMTELQTKKSKEEYQLDKLTGRVVAKTNENSPAKVVNKKTKTDQIIEEANQILQKDDFATNEALSFSKFDLILAKKEQIDSTKGIMNSLQHRYGSSKKLVKIANNSAQKLLLSESALHKSNINFWKQREQFKSQMIIADSNQQNSFIDGPSFARPSTSQINKTSSMSAIQDFNRSATNSQHFQGSNHLQNHYDRLNRDSIPLTQQKQHHSQSIILDEQIAPQIQIVYKEQDNVGSIQVVDHGKEHESKYLRKKYFSSLHKVDFDKLTFNVEQRVQKEKEVKKRLAKLQMRANLRQKAKLYKEQKKNVDNLVLDKMQLVADRGHGGSNGSEDESATDESTSDSDSSIDSQDSLTSSQQRRRKQRQERREKAELEKEQNRNANLTQEQIMANTALIITIKKQIYNAIAKMFQTKGKADAQKDKMFFMAESIKKDFKAIRSKVKKEIVKESRRKSKQNSSLDVTKGGDNNQNNFEGLPLTDRSQQRTRNQQKQNNSHSRDSLRVSRIDSQTSLLSITSSQKLRQTQPNNLSVEKMSDVKKDQRLTRRTAAVLTDKKMIHDIQTSHLTGNRQIPKATSSNMYKDRFRQEVRNSAKIPFQDFCKVLQQAVKAISTQTIVQMTQLFGLRRHLQSKMQKQMRQQERAKNEEGGGGLIGNVDVRNIQRLDEEATIKTSEIIVGIFQDFAIEYSKSAHMKKEALILIFFVLKAEGDIFQEMRDFDKAIKAYKALKNFCLHWRQFRLAMLMAEQIGICYRITQFHCKAIDVFKKMLAYAWETKDEYGEIRAYNHLSLQCYYMNDIPRMVAYEQKYISMHIEPENSSLKQASLGLRKIKPNLDFFQNQIKGLDVHDVEKKVDFSQKSMPQNNSREILPVKALITHDQNSSKGELTQAKYEKKILEDIQKKEKIKFLQRQRQVTRIITKSMNQDVLKEKIRDTYDPQNSHCTGKIDIQQIGTLHERLQRAAAASRMNKHHKPKDPNQPLPWISQLSSQRYKPVMETKDYIIYNRVTERLNKLEQQCEYQIKLFCKQLETPSSNKQ